MRFDLRTTKLTAALAAALVLVAAGACVGFFFADWLRQDLAASSANAAPETAANGSAGDPLTAQTVVIAETQLAAVQVEPAGERLFPIEKDAVGSIDFNEDMSTP